MLTIDSQVNKLYWLLTTGALLSQSSIFSVILTSTGIQCPCLTHRSKHIKSKEGNNQLIVSFAIAQLCCLRIIRLFSALANYKRSYMNIQTHIYIYIYISIRLKINIMHKFLKTSPAQVQILSSRNRFCFPTFDLDFSSMTPSELICLLRIHQRINLMQWVSVQWHVMYATYRTMPYIDTAQ